MISPIPVRPTCPSSFRSHFDTEKCEFHGKQPCVSPYSLRSARRTSDQKTCGRERWGPPTVRGRGKPPRGRHSRFSNEDRYSAEAASAGAQEAASFILISAGTVVRTARGIKPFVPDLGGYTSIFLNDAYFYDKFPPKADIQFCPST